jgi:hypothetical protein
LHESIAMARGRELTDRRPGPAPDIRADGDSVTFGLAIDGLREGLRLMIRCDGDGNICAWIVQSAVDR